MAVFRYLSFSFLEPRVRLKGKGHPCGRREKERERLREKEERRREGEEGRYAIPSHTRPRRRQSRAHPRVAIRHFCSPADRGRAAETAERLEGEGGEGDEEEESRNRSSGIRRTLRGSGLRGCVRASNSSPCPCRELCRTCASTARNI